MKIQILKDGLKQALSVVERATAKTPILPALGAIAIIAKKNTLELSATDLEMGIRYKLLAKTEKEGEAVVSSRLLSQLVGTLAEREINMELQGGELKIESTEQQTNIKTLPLDDFPIIPSLGGEEIAVELETKAFCAGLSQVVGVVGQNQARPEISGVLVSIGKDDIKLVATDSFRLAEKSIILNKTQPVETSFILPQKTTKELIAILGDLSGTTKLYSSATQALFDYSSKEVGTPSIQIISRIIEGEYPQYQDVIPKDFVTKARVQKQELISSLRAASIFSGKMQDAKVVADPKKKGLEISSQSADTGRHNSFLPCDITGEHLEISFNWRFLLEGLSNIKGEEVEIAFAGEDAPALLRPTGKEQYLYVVMPVKA